MSQRDCHQIFQWDDIKTDTEDDDTQIQYHFSDDDGSEDVDGVDDEDDDYQFACYKQLCAQVMSDSQKYSVSN